MSEKPNEAEENPEAEDRSGRRLSTWILGGLSLVFLYFISFGPVMFTTIKFQDDVPDMVNQALEAIYAPHAALM